jgi:hypothetical protein
MEDKRFIHIGRSSTYGLKIWEHKKVQFKGGTIRDIVREFLLKKSRIAHLLEIYEHCKKYRPKTSIKSIRRNLEVDSKGDFIFYPQQFIGLISFNNTSEVLKYENLPRQLGKSIKSRLTYGHSINSIKSYLERKYHLSFEESSYILEYLNASVPRKNISSNIISEKHKVGIIDLIKKGQLFDASQEYLKLAYENGQVNSIIIMEEFEKIVESIDD